MHLASALYKAGKKHESDSVLNVMIEQSKTLPNYDFRIATVYAARGEKNEALKWYKSAYEKRGFWILFTRVTPDLDIIKDDPEVKKVMNDIGL